MVFSRKLRAMAADYRRDRDSYRAAAAEIPVCLRAYLMLRAYGVIFFFLGVAWLTMPLFGVSDDYLSLLWDGGGRALLGLAFWFSAVPIASNVAKSGDRANPANDPNTLSK